MAAAAGRTRLPLSAVETFILRDPVFERAWQRHHKRLSASQWLTGSQQMQPVSAAKDWLIPRLETARELADWFWLDDGQLQWFADLHGLAEKIRNVKLRHYHYRILEKASGGLRLKEMQRQILDYIWTQFRRTLPCMAL